MTPSPAALHVDNLSFLGRDGTVLLHGVDFDLEPGRILAVAGPNGAGKSTLMKLLVGLARPSAGRIRIDGVDLARLSMRTRARTIAYVGQSDRPDGRLTIRDYVALGAVAGGINGGTPTAVADALGLTGLEHLAATRMDRISGGEAQRAQIARAICQRPSLLVLDEPTNHLDPRARGDLLGLVARLGVTVVSTLHELTLVDEFADCLLVMQRGRATHYGATVDTLTPELVRNVFRVDFHRFDHPYTARAVPALDISLHPKTEQ